MGDALRWDQAHNLIFAHGRVQLSLPGILIEAESLGSQLELQQGEAWNVNLTYRQAINDSNSSLNGEELTATQPTAFVERQLMVEHLTWNEQEITATGITARGGHGGLLQVRADSLTIGRRPRPLDYRDGAARHLRFIKLKGITIALGGLPVGYLPIAYRDFIRDYPWTRYQFSNDSRLGYALDAAIGWRLPPLAGWHIRPQFEADIFEQYGTGLGLRVSAEHDQWGSAEAHYYGVFHGRGQRNDFHYQGFDLSWRDTWGVPPDRWSATSASEGQGAVSLRWSHIPDSWPGEDPRQLYHDLHRADAQHRPLPRQGAVSASNGPKPQSRLIRLALPRMSPRAVNAI